jgi:hypothetical protein
MVKLRNCDLTPDIRLQIFFNNLGVFKLAKQVHHFGNSRFIGHIIAVGYAYIF